MYTSSKAKALLKRSTGWRFPKGIAEVTSPEDAAAACEELGGTCVVKAQIHAGGRGKARRREGLQEPRRGAGVRLRDPRQDSW